MDPRLFGLCRKPRALNFLTWIRQYALLFSNLRDLNRGGTVLGCRVLVPQKTLPPRLTRDSSFLLIPFTLYFGYRKHNYLRPALMFVLLLFIVDSVSILSFISRFSLLYILRIYLLTAAGFTAFFILARSIMWSGSSEYLPRLSYLAWRLRPCPQNRPAPPAGAARRRPARRLLPSPAVWRLIWTAAAL